MLDRVEAQQAYYDAKRRKTPADEAAMTELGRIIHRYLSIDVGFDAAFATLGGYTLMRVSEIVIAAVTMRPGAPTSTGATGSA